MHTISWNLKALCSGQVTPLTPTPTHAHTSQPWSSCLDRENSAWKCVKVKCILSAWVIWDKVQETLKKQKTKQGYKSVSSFRGGDTVLPWKCVSCMFTWVIWYLACNSSLQTPAAASGQVCGCPRLPWGRSSSTPSHRCLPRYSHLPDTQIQLWHSQLLFVNSFLFEPEHPEPFK